MSTMTQRRNLAMLRGFIGSESPSHVTTNGSEAVPPLDLFGCPPSSAKHVCPSRPAYDLWQWIDRSLFVGGSPFRLSSWCPGDPVLPCCSALTVPISPYLSVPSSSSSVSMSVSTSLLSSAPT